MSWTLAVLCGTWHNLNILQTRQRTRVQFAVGNRPHIRRASSNDWGIVTIIPNFSSSVNMESGCETEFKKTAYYQSIRRLHFWDKPTLLHDKAYTTARELYRGLANKSSYVTFSTNRSLNSSPHPAASHCAYDDVPSHEVTNVSCTTCTYVALVNRLVNWSRVDATWSHCFGTKLYILRNCEPP